MDKIVFSIFKLIIGGDNENFSLSNFSDIKDEEKIPSGDNNNRRIAFVNSKPMGEKFFSVYLQEGKSKPRPKEVYSIIKESQEPNPREEHQIEMDTQTFVLIEPEMQRIFISNLNKKKQIADWLKVKLGMQVFIKNIINKEKFLDNIKIIKSIEFGAEDDLFSAESGDLDQFLKYDVHGFGMEVERASIKIDFKERGSITDKAITEIKRLFQQQEEYSLGKLTVTGRTDENLDRVFNSEEIIEKIIINPDRNEEGLFDEQKVFGNLIQEISNRRLK